MNILDCTLRDAGYLNNWSFSAETSDEIVRLAATSGVNWVEVGYLDDADDLFETAGLPVTTLRRFHGIIQNEVRIAAMMRPNCENAEVVLDSRFGWVDMIRIPTSVSDPKPALVLAQLAVKRGYQVSLNLTNISAFSLVEIGNAVAQISGVDVVYLADSRGAVEPWEIPKLIETVQKNWNGPIGFHAHDNQKCAIENTKLAADCGCEWIDGTIAGMGLGGRNLRLEDALAISGRNVLDRLRTAKESDWLDSIEAVPKELYRLASKSNFPQDWVDTLLSTRTSDELMKLLSHIPRSRWMHLVQLKPWLEEKPNVAPCIRLRKYSSQGCDHNQAASIFYNLVKPVHEKHGAVFLGREVLPDESTVVRWIYPSERMMRQIQSDVRLDPETTRNRGKRKQGGLHGVSFIEIHYHQ